MQRLSVVRRREFVFGALGSVVYLVACGSDSEGGSNPPDPNKPDGSTPPPRDEVGGPLTPTSPDTDSHRVFPQGVASGDPRPDRVVLWTRVEPAEAGKTANDDIDLVVVIARDEALTDLVVRTRVKALAKGDHTVRVVPTELEPGKTYHYRFEVEGKTTTQVGRTKTAPAPDSDVPVKFAMAACQDYIGRHWHSWKALLDEKPDLDFVLYLGDYIYETVNDARFQSTGMKDRSIELPDGLDTSFEQNKSRMAATTLADYRTIYKVYKKEPLLREVHRLYPFIITWDDHEFSDDCWQDHSTSFNGEDPKNPGKDLPGDEKNTPRRTNANHAFWDFQPIDVGYKPNLPHPFDIKIYRNFRYGKHVELFMTDQRGYRADHLIPEGTGTDFACGKFLDFSMIGSRYFVRKEGFDPKEKSAKPSLLGAEQKAWFLDAVKKSTATWKVWGNEVQVYQMTLDLWRLPGVPDKIGPFEPYTVYVNADQWDGYRSERIEILDQFQKANVENLLVCTGDIHSFYAAELHVDFDKPGAKPVGVEYVTAGISSASLKTLFDKFISKDSPFRFVIDAWAAAADRVLMESSKPHLKYADTNAYGFSIMTIDGQKAVAEFIELDEPTNPVGKVLGRKKFATDVGTNLVKAL